MTVIYFVRHAESVYVEGQEKARGLSPQGRLDAVRVADLLSGTPIDHMVSSTYARAIETIRELAHRKGMEIEQMEDLRERAIGHFEPLSFAEAKQKVYDNPGFSFEGGESSEEAKARAIPVIRKLLQEREGQTIVVGTHGDMMTLMMHDFDPRFDFRFWIKTTMPDIYRLEFDGMSLKKVTRHWERDLS